HLALEDRGDVAREPPVPSTPILAVDRLREPPTNHSLHELAPLHRRLVLGTPRFKKQFGYVRPVGLLQLGLRKRPEGQYLHPAGQRFGNLWHEKRVGGTGEEEATRPAVA